jgi:pimeloyl-ACP methyl ester carboxylesterase
VGNLEIHVDGTVSPWLARERHRAIVDSMLAHRPQELYAQVECPALLLVAGAGNPAASAAAAAIPHAELVAFPGGDHDLHAQHPEEVAALIGRLA